MSSILSVVSAIAFVYWVFVAIGSVRAIRSVPLLERLDPPRPPRWPRVSVVIPACNEADTIELALRSRLAEGYPNAEYIVVDDRSTDDTGEIVDRLAREDARVVPVHVDALPDGWLGKVHAMHTALGRATGELVLFSDADVHHEPGTLERVVAHLEDRRIDHVAIFPTIWSATFALDVMMNTFLRIAVVMCRAWSIPDPTSRASVGGGVFNLVRREALERAGGLEPLKLEVIDDAGLGQLLKWSGARQAVLNGRGFVRLWFYRSLMEAVRGMEKNAFAVLGRFSVPLFTFMIGSAVLLELGSVTAALAAHGWPRVLGACGLAIAIGAQLVVTRWLRRPLLPSLLAPAGAAAIVVAAVRSMILTMLRGGVVWRGTRYSLEALRRGRRLVLA